MLAAAILPFVLSLVAVHEVHGEDPGRTRLQDLQLVFRKQQKYGADESKQITAFRHTSTMLRCAKAQPAVHAPRFFRVEGRGG